MIENRNTATGGAPFGVDELELLDYLLDAEIDSLPQAAILKRGSVEPPPLSFAQQRLWFLDQLGSGTAYNMPIARKFTGPLNVAALEQALQEVVCRHESLRTTFVVDEGIPHQVIHPDMSIDLPLVDLGGYEPSEQTGEVQRLAIHEVAHPFDLSCDPMLRATLLRLAEAEHVLLLTLHHIASDGWSIGVLAREIATKASLTALATRAASSRAPTLW